MLASWGRLRKWITKYAKRAPKWRKKIKSITFNSYLAIYWGVSQKTEKNLGLG